MEEEVREILRDATKHEDSNHQGSLGTEIAARFRKIGLKAGKRFPSSNVLSALMHPESSEQI